MIEINCPVCEYQEIVGDICPNCDTDISLIRKLQELPQIEESGSIKFSIKLLVSGLIIFLVGVGLALLSNYLFLPSMPMQSEIVTNSSPQVALEVSPRNPQPATYSVKSGEHLSRLAEKFCGADASWQVMAEVNPQLKGREDHLEIGEVLNIPSCQEGI